MACKALPFACGISMSQLSRKRRAALRSPTAASHDQAKPLKGSFPVQEQVQALRDDNVALAAALVVAREALTAQAERAQRTEASLQARLEDARTGTGAAQERAQEARRERDFFMAQSTEAAAHAAAAVSDRDAALQVGRSALSPVQLPSI